MARPTIVRRWLTVSLLSTPALALAQPEWVEAARDDAPGWALFILAIAIIATIYGLVRDRRRHDSIARFLEKGQEVPSGLLPQQASPQRELRRGVWLTSLGLGVGLVLYIATGNLRVAAWCLILLFLGGASLLNAVFFYPRK